MRSNFRIYFFFGLVSILLASCNKVPGELLSQKEMQAVLIDMHLAETMMNSDYTAYADASKKEALYASVFRKHNTTQAVYDSSLMWYGRNLDVYMAVYDRVLVEMNAEKKGYDDFLANIMQAKVDSFSIWTGVDSVIFQKNIPDKAFFFDYQPEDGYLPGSQFLFTMQVWGLNEKMSHYPQVRLSVEHADTTFTVIREIKNDGLFEELIKSVAIKDVTRVYGYIRLDNKDNNNYYKIYINDIQLKRYNYGVEIKLMKDTLDAKTAVQDSLVKDSVADAARDSVAALLKDSLAGGKKDSVAAFVKDSTLRKDSIKK